MYNNARFQPNDQQFTLAVITQINSLMKCACQCFGNSMCLTATYIGVNQSCTLFSARPEQGSLKLMFTSTMASVLTFINKTLPSMYLRLSKSSYMTLLK